MFLGLCIREIDLKELHRNHVELLDLFAQGDCGEAKRALNAHIIQDLIKVDYESIVARLRAERAAG